MLPRLYEIEDDLMGRRNRAEHEGWLGEIEGIDLTLAPSPSSARNGIRLDGSSALPHRSWDAGHGGGRVVLGSDLAKCSIPADFHLSS
jgi:hypothetical protein